LNGFSTLPRITNATPHYQKIAESKKSMYAKFYEDLIIGSKQYGF
jgi:hypothetical protein